MCGRCEAPRTASVKSDRDVVSHGDVRGDSDEGNVSMPYRKIACVTAICIVSIYVSSYIVLSRRGFVQADAWNAKGFYFVKPENTDKWRFWNYTLAKVYGPLVAIDNAIGTGRPIASEPMWPDGVVK
jgi:hypothetical protein